MFTRLIFIDLHSNGIIHTDLKPENICLTRRAYPGEVPQTLPDFSGGQIRLDRSYKYLHDLKITVIDFSSAVKTKRDQSPMRKIVTTKPYRAPEVSARKGWSFPCDIWSIGCILLELDSGHRAGSREFKTRQKEALQGAKDHRCRREHVTLFNRLVAEMLAHDPDCRISAIKALDDPWFKTTIFDYGLLFPLNPQENVYIPGMMTPRIIMNFIEGPLFWLLRYRNPTEVFHENDIKRAVIEKLLDVDLSAIPAAIVAANEVETDEQKLAVFLQNRPARHLMEYVAEEVFTGKNSPALSYQKSSRRT
jgi:serine/threonine protein kinase